MLNLNKEIYRNNIPTDGTLHHNHAQSSTFNVVGEFLYRVGAKPSAYKFEYHAGIWADKVIQELEREFKVTLTHIHTSYTFENGAVSTELTFTFLNQGALYFLTLDGSQEVQKYSRYYRTYGKDFRKEFRQTKDITIATNINLYCANTEAEVPKFFKEIVPQLFLQDKPRKTVEREDDEFRISVIVPRQGGGFKVRTVGLQFASSDASLALHYGKDFVKYHETLVERLQNSTKGIALFHGMPGTGKTSYIRHLAKSLNDMGKRVLFIPSAVFDEIGTPAFTSFMLEEFGRVEAGTVFVLEDAETLLKKRDESSQADKVSNLLNLGDGILNDLFKVQIVATFNTELKNIDPAFLRSGRLLARKEFGPLNVDDAKTLAKHIGVKPDIISAIATPQSLAQVFAHIEEEQDNLLIEKAEVLA